MEKTNPLRWKLFGLLCALLLSWGGLPVTAQDCPNFQWSDFTTSLMQPNQDCNKPGIATIRYSNNIVGVDAVHYQFGTSCSGPWFYETDAAVPGATVKRKFRPHWPVRTFTCASSLSAVAEGAPAVGPWEVSARATLRTSRWSPMQPPPVTVPVRVVGCRPT